MPMAINPKSDTYSQLLNIMTDYLGPASDRFLKRQIELHLKKHPQEITATDLDHFKEWVKVSLALLTQDHAMIEQCINRIEALS